MNDSKKRREEELEKEVRGHLELEMEERRAQGATPRDAADDARRVLGNTAMIREDVREAWGWMWLEQTWQDVRYGTRQLARSLGSTGIAVLTLAIGIGATTTVFSWMREVLLNPLPGAGDASRVVALESLAPSGEWKLTSYLDFRDFRNYTKLPEAMSAHRVLNVAVGDQTGAEHMWAQAVSGNFFDLLEVKPAIGRFFEGDELSDTQNAHQVVVISHGLWEKRFQSDASAIGKTLRLNQHPYTVIGVAPQTFHGSLPGLDFEMWVPATMWGQLTATGDWMLRDRKTRMFGVLVRLRQGVSLEQTREEIRAFAARMAEADADTNAGMSATLLTMWQSHYGVQDTLRGPLSVGMCVCGLVLLIVCANVSNLLLARATSRRKEFSIRLALGAPRGRLVRQILTETFLLAAAGALAGWVATSWLVGALRWLHPTAAIPSVQTPLDISVLVFMAGLAFAVALVAGLAPALQAAGENVNEMLKESGRGGSSSGRAQRLRGLLVTSEVALAVIALVGAGLFVKSFDTARLIRPGFDAAGMVIARFSLSTVGYDAPQTDAFCQRLREEMGKQPGITAVSYADTVPLGTGEDSWEDLRIEGYVPAPNENMKIWRNLVAPGFFATMKIPFVQGRDFDLRDTHESQPVMIVSRAFVDRFLPNQEVMGKKVYGWGKWFTIVGEVEDAKYHQYTEPRTPYFYVPIRQIFRPEMGVTFFIRTAGDANQAIAEVRDEARRIDPALPVFNAMLLSDDITYSLFGQRIAASLLGVLGTIGMLLAAVGLYGVMAYAVAQRTNEIGIRMTLGAQRGDVLRMVVRQGLRYALPGLVAGAIAALVLARVASSALVAVSPADPGVYAIATAATLLIALVSTAIPAWRAMRVDPMVALREF